jgi:hypothetical protein
VRPLSPTWKTCWRSIRGARSATSARGSPQLLCQQPCGLVGDAELVLQLTRRHSVGMGCHEMCCPEPCCQWQLGAMHRRPVVTEVCRPQSRHSCKRGRLFSPTTRRSPQPGHTKPFGQRCLNKKAAQPSSSENDFLNSAGDRALAISTHPRDRANPIAQHTTCGGKRDR